MRIDRAKFTAALANADITANTLAERSGVSRVTVSNVRAGKRCTEETASKLAAGLGVPVSEIIKEVE